MITYKETMPGIHLPVLHRVYYSRDLLKNFDLRYWCNAKCQARFYESPSWTKECFVEFEDDKDAVLFALRWA